MTQDADFKEGVDCVVVNYKTYDHLEKFIQSYIFQYGGVASDLYVIDVDVDAELYDYASERLSAYTKEIQICYLPLSYNAGYSGACNFGATLGNHDTIAFFNSDTQLFDNTLESCRTVLHSDPSYAVVGPLQVNSDGLMTHGGIFGTNSKPDFAGRWKSKVLPAYRKIEEAVTVSGSAYFVKRSIWEDFTNDPEWQSLYPSIEGAFLPTPHYYEETWFSYLARHRGYKVIYNGEAEMIHEWHKSSKVGEVEALHLDKSRAMFRNTCDKYGIEHD